MHFRLHEGVKTQKQTFVMQNVEKSGCSFQKIKVIHAGWKTLGVVCIKSAVFIGVLNVFMAIFET